MAQTLQILVTLPLNGGQKAALRQQAPDAAFTYLPEKVVDAEKAGSFEVIIGHVPLSLLPFCKRLKWLQLGSAGAEGFRDPGVMPRGAALTCATGAYGQAVAEHAFAMLLCLMKKLPLYRDNQRERVWKDEGEVASLRGKTILILGLGDIGSCFSRMVRPFGVKIIGVRRSGKGSEAADEVHTLEALDSLLPLSDVVLCSLPDTGETRDILSSRQFDLMKSTALLLNVGRGSAVDTDALCDAVLEGRIRGAGLDVTRPEPLPPDHRLWGIPNILLTPHIGGGFHLQETLEQVVRISAENLRLFCEGKELMNIVGGKGYAKRG